MLKRGKGGSGHLEMIISFVFFVVFVSAILLFLNPYNRNSLSQTVIVGISESVKNTCSTNLTELFLEADYSGSKDCFFVNLPGLDKTFSDSFVETAKGGKFVESDINPSGKLSVRKDGTYYRVYISEEFDDGSPLSGCDKLEDFTVGSITYRTPLSYKSLLELKNQYETNYEVMKKKIGVPEILDFAIVSDDLPEISMQRSRPLSVDVFSKDFVFEVLKNDSAIINANFRILAW